MFLQIFLHILLARKRDTRLQQLFFPDKKNNPFYEKNENFLLIRLLARMWA